MQFAFVIKRRLILKSAGEASDVGRKKVSGTFQGENILRNCIFNFE